MKIVIELLGVLRRELGHSRVEVSLDDPNIRSLRDLLKYLLATYPKLSSAINSDGTLNTSYMVFVNDVDFMLVGGYDYEVSEGDKLTFIPISHGGSNAANVDEVWGKLCADLSRIELAVSEIRRDEALKLINEIDEVQVEGCITQVLPSTLVLSDKQILLASLLTFKAIEEGRNISRKPHIEFLLRLFSNRQISDVVNMIKDVRSSKYYVIRVCRRVGGSERYSPLMGVEVNPSELFKMFEVEGLKDLVKAYGIVGESDLDTGRAHSLILTKISLFQIVS